MEFAIYSADDNSRISDIFTSERDAIDARNKLESERSESGRARICVFYIANYPRREGSVVLGDYCEPR